MKEQRADIFMLYYQKRNGVIWRSFVLPIVFVLLASLSTAGGVAINDPWQILGGAIDNGYVVVFGPLVVLLCVLWFQRTTSTCLSLRSSIETAVAAGDLGEEQMNAVESHMISAPVLIRSVNASSRIVVGVGLGAILIFMYCLSQWQPDAKNPLPPLQRFAAIFLGFPMYWLEGIDPTWERFPRMKLPWLYPPYYTAVYVCTIVYLIRTLRDPGHAGESGVQTKK